MKKPDLLAALKPVVKAFEEIGVLYYIGGSIASSALGIARATLDVDVVANIKPQQVKLFVEKLQSEYYIDAEIILSAIKVSSAFNLIHLETMLKIDVFILKKTPYSQQAFERRIQDTLDEEMGSTPIYLCSAEDIILNKLEWYHSGGEVSERQWLDVLGVIKVQAYALDEKYLRYWATELGVSGLLEKALTEGKAWAT